MRLWITKWTLVSLKSHAGGIPYVGEELKIQFSLVSSEGNSLILAGWKEGSTIGNGYIVMSETWNQDLWSLVR